MPTLGIRWTIGDVSPAGFEALALSIRGAHRCFGEDAAYVVCVNSVSLDHAHAVLGPLPTGVELRAALRSDLPGWLEEHVDGALSQGTSWKFAPLRVHEGIPELALDNDCILWRVPEAVARWLDDPDPRACLIAADVRAAFGKLAPHLGPEPRNSGIRGLGPAFDLEAAMRAVLRETGVVLESELDEQGLQIRAVSRARAPWVVSVDDVTICSPVPPHRRELGRAGAHFVGLNARTAWCRVDGRPITELVAEHWSRLRPEVGRLVGVAEGGPPRAAERATPCCARTR